MLNLYGRIWVGFWSGNSAMSAHFSLQMCETMAQKEEWMSSLSNSCWLRVFQKNKYPVNKSKTPILMNWLKSSTLKVISIMVGFKLYSYEF